MSLIRDIQAATISQSTDVPNLLRMCKLLAARLGNEQFAQWVEHELNGYPDIQSLPEYRKVRVKSYGSFIGSFARAPRLQIPISILPEKLRDSYRHAYMFRGISAYVSLIQIDKKETIIEEWPMELAVHFASRAVVDMQCVAAWKEIPEGTIFTLLDSVKTRILGFAIDLEREAPDAGDSPIGNHPVSQEKVTQIFNTNIAGPVGNLSNASSSFSQVANLSIQSGDWAALHSYLQSLGLSASDLQGLQADLDEARNSGKSAKEALEGTPRSWIDRLTAKATEGATGVGIEVAATGIAKAIAAYLGLPGA